MFTNLNLLIQGLPSSIEKQFLKLSFAKSVTPLLRNRGIDFALVFAVNKKQLYGILNDVVPALGSDACFWIAYPKVTSKIASDLTRDANWYCLSEYMLESMHKVDLDTVWSAMRFCKESAKSKKALKAIAQNLDSVLN